MASGPSDDIRYVKLNLLIVKAGVFAQKKLIQKMLTSDSKCIDEYLNDNKDEINLAWKKRHISEKHINVLFPELLKPTDLECWDITLYSYIIISLFNEKLENAEQIAIKELRRKRNDLAHSGSTIMSEVQFCEEWDHLIMVLNQLTKGLTEAEQHEFDDTVQKILSIEDFRFATNDEFVQHVITKLKSHDYRLNEVEYFLVDPETWREYKDAFIRVKILEEEMERQQELNDCHRRRFDELEAYKVGWIKLLKFLVFMVLGCAWYMVDVRLSCSD